MTTVTLYQEREKSKLNWTLENGLDWGIKLLVALTGLFASKGITTLIERKLSKLKQTKQDKKRQSHYDTLVAMRDCKEFMNRMGKLNSVHRVLLLKGSNSGGIPVLGAPYYTRAIDGAGDYAYALENFKETKVDLQYIQLLINVISQKKITIDVDSISTSLIKNIYDTEGVKKSIWYFLGSNEMEIFFMSVSTKSEFDKNEYAEIDIMANNISTLFDNIGQ